MKDFRVVHAKAVLTVSSIAPVRNFDPPSIIVLGDRLNRANEITYNGVQVDEWVVSSESRLVLRIPNSQVGRELAELLVLATVQFAEQDALVQLGLARPVRAVSGIDRLVQQWVMTFLTTPGSDVFNLSSGGGGRSLVGKSVGGNTVPAADIAIAVERTKSQLLKAQANNSSIPPSERLLSASLVSVSYDKSNTTAYAVVDLRNVVGASSLVQIG
jgi:hypothetical protein